MPAAADVTRIRVLALSPVPEEGASARFRVYQFLPELAAAGFDVEVRPFFTPDFFRIVYAPGARARMALLARRREFDVVLVHREAVPIGPPWMEALLARSGRPLVFDFDDAVYLDNASDANRMIWRFKYPKKTVAIVRWSAAVIAGNDYLAAWASRHNPATVVIPTSVDTDVFVPRADGGSAHEPRVGWIGSHSTAKYLKSLRSALTKVGAEHAYRLDVVGSRASFTVPGVPTTHREWSLTREVTDFAACDVGVYPLWDDEWARGKCAFKAIQFMACGVPVVASPIGANRDVIQDGVNGFLAASEAEWVEKLGWLIADGALREKLGQAGRRTVEDRYSRRVNGPRVVDVIRAASHRRPGSA
jgi:glycosyltransferase involved in cell wall biosynthesis